MDWGLQQRLSRIVQPKTGRAVMLAIDHGYFLGATTGLEKPSENIRPLLPYADALMLTRGLLRTSFQPSECPAIVLRVSGGSSILKELSQEGITVSMKEALRLNAAAVAISIFVGSENEKETLLNLSHLVNEAVEYGMPVLAVTAVGREMARDARYLGLCCRIAAELGANFVKTYYCEDFERVIENCPVPIVVAGGKKIEEKKALALADNAVSLGAVGVDMGRNIFQSSDPAGMIQAVREVVHERKSVEEAYARLKQEKVVA